jgi:hypothetical protein
MNRRSIASCELLADRLSRRIAALRVSGRFKESRIAETTLSDLLSPQLDGLTLREGVSAPGSGR